MRISRRTHHWTQALSGVHVHVSWKTNWCYYVNIVAVLICGTVDCSALTCVDVWVGLWMHGAVAHWRLHCPLWLDSCASKELIDGGAEVCNLSGLERPVIQLRLPHTLFQTFRKTVTDYLISLSSWFLKTKMKLLAKRYRFKIKCTVNIQNKPQK